MRFRLLLTILAVCGKQRATPARGYAAATQKTAAYL
jgi:hypothetical protein